MTKLPGPSLHYCPLSPSSLLTEKKKYSTVMTRSHLYLFAHRLTPSQPRPQRSTRCWSQLGLGRRCISWAIWFLVVFLGYELFYSFYHCWRSVNEPFLLCYNGLTPWRSPPHPAHLPLLPCFQSPLHDVLQPLSLPPAHPQIGLSPCQPRCCPPVY
jgi:hypothetical protein